MQLHQLKPSIKQKKKKRIGRGGKRGTYSGRGVKGQKARAGRKLMPSIREIIKRYPKLRGYKEKAREESLSVVNIDVLDKRFKSGEVVSPDTLIKKRIINKIKGKVPKVKILGKGEISKDVIIDSCKVSKSAEEKIKKAGGKIKTSKDK